MEFKLKINKNLDKKTKNRIEKLSKEFAKNEFKNVTLEAMHRVTLRESEWLCKITFMEGYLQALKDIEKENNKK